jgi:hypothetical protein
MSEAKVRILGPVENRQVQTKNGPKTIYFQPIELETEHMRIREELEVDGPNMGHPAGAVRVWDVVADLVPGRYGTELARRKTLREANDKPESKPRAVAAG